jgi:hypothetical protein
MAMLCAQDANKVDWVGTLDDFNFDVFLHHLATSVLEVK